MSTDLREKFAPSQLIIVVLSIYVLVTLLATSFFKLPHEVVRLLEYIDDGICIIFLVDFTNRFIKAPNKLQFMKWGWIDLISSIPAFHFARAGRALQLIRLLRILRAFRSTRILVQFVFRKKAQGAFMTALIIAILVLIFSCIAILEVETAPNSNIKTAGDAIWWAFVTITTVGYGDRYPVTTAGRIIAVFLMTTGVGLFGIFTGFVASLFTEGKKAEENRSSDEMRGI